MTRVDLATLDPAFAELARSGETVVLYEGDAPIAELKPVEGARSTRADPGNPYDRAKAFGRYESWMTEAEIHEALRPMTDDEAERFIDTGTY